MEDVVELTERAFRALERGDVDAFVAQAHPEIEFNSLLAEADRRSFHGHEGVREWFDLMQGTMGGIRIETESFEALDYPDTALVKMKVMGEASGVEIAQVMWQVVHAPDGQARWWAISRTREDALADAAERLG